MLDYSMVQSVSEDEFNEKGFPLSKAKQTSSMRKATTDELKKVEMILDVRPGTLSTLEFYMTDTKDENGETIGIYDFILTSLIDAGHSKSFVLHTLLGNKFVISNNVKHLRNSRGARLSGSFEYSTFFYSCKGAIEA